ncbi:MAG: carboxymuconolactone decarboxylase family protein [Planctomycetota bacterium]
MNARLTLIDPARATGPQKELLDAVKAKMGLVPNLTRALANSPAALKSYLDFSGALAGSSLSARQREQLALAVAEVNACGYCLSAHTLIGGKLGLKEEQVLDARRGLADDAKTGALLKLAQRIVLERGHLKDADLRVAYGVNDTQDTMGEGMYVLIRQDYATP